MKFYLAALTLAVVGAGAQSTVLAPCGTACPTAPPADKSITRTKAMPTETSPCPSVIVSSIAGNASNPTAGSPSPPTYSGGAAHIGGSMGAAIAVGAAFLAL